jgi:hypothetical protein
MIDFWIVRRGENAQNIAPDIYKLILKHPDRKKCLFCGDGHEIGAVVAFCWREPGAEILTTGICADCAGHEDDKLAEMTGKEVFPEWFTFVKCLDELKAMGLIERVEDNPATGMDDATSPRKR